MDNTPENFTPGAVFSLIFLGSSFPLIRTFRSEFFYVVIIKLF